MIEYASVRINRYLVGKDGKTAYERLKGKTSKMIGIEFAETVTLWRAPTPGRSGKLESTWEEGTFCGYKAGVASTWSRMRRGHVRCELCGEFRPGGDG